MKNIIDTLTECAKTFAAAVAVAGLDQTLIKSGPFTVFAPSDAAFAAVQQDLDRLLEPGNTDKLAKMLNAHIVHGKILAADLQDGQILTSLENDLLRISINNGVWRMNSAEVTSADIEASNGVIHMLDEVCLNTD
jgi:uncharacterized surface protein with fasciclin (FAS1) repeats